MSIKSDVKHVENFLARFRDNYVSVNLTRIGGSSDGGYLIPNVLDSVSHCFSPGVDYTASFESDLSKGYGIKSFMADASVSQAPSEDANFIFIKKFLGNRTHGGFVTLSDWIDSSLDGTERELILQMDIEGGEYDVLTVESEVTLNRFSVMVIEFHALGNMFEKHFLQMFTSIFEKIYRNFSICHVHPNNCCGIVTLNDISVPRVIEVTFLRNDLVEKYKSTSNVSLPHELDGKNVINKDDIRMPDKWWK